MAKIVESFVTVKISKIVKNSEPDTLDIVTQDLLDSLEVVATELCPDSIVEVEIVE